MMNNIAVYGNISKSFDRRLVNLLCAPSVSDATPVRRTASTSTGTTSCDAHPCVATAPLSSTSTASRRWRPDVARRPSSQVGSLSSNNLVVRLTRCSHQLFRCLLNKTNKLCLSGRFYFGSEDIILLLQSS